MTFIIKELARKVSGATMMDFQRLKKALRYLRGTSGATLKLSWDPELPADRLFVRGDASWASGQGCKSTTGYLLRIQGFLLLHSSKTQATLAQSSAEAELIAGNAAVVEGLLAKNILEEMSRPTQLVLETDAKAMIDIVRRRGPGRLKHLELKQLWLQQAHADGRVVEEKITSEENEADVLTKPVATGRLRKLSEKMGMSFERSEDEHELYVLEEDDSTWRRVFTIIFTLIGVIVTLHKVLALTWRWLRVRLRGERRTVQTQTCVTYTELRGSAQPRFVSVPEALQGAWVVRD